MIILIEGCDKTGKSTLISDFRTLFPVSTIFKNTIKPGGKTGVEIGRTSGIYLGAYQFANLVEKITVFDRSHITEVVYAPRRGYDSLKHVDWLEYEKLLLGKAMVVYMHAPEQTIVKRFKTENETYIEESEVHEILERYDAYLGMTKLPVLKLSSLDKRDANLQKLVYFVNNNRNLWISENSKMKSFQSKTNSNSSSNAKQK